ncbi:MAG: type II secretion system F family protein [Candidatus Jettenia sp.]|nr:type II secretion system F family protein [Candidatus Jettenia sp.]
MELVISIAVFFTMLLIITGIFFLMGKRRPDSRRIQEQIREFSTRIGRNQTIDIVRKKRPLSNIPWLNRLLLGIPFLRKIDLILLQSNLQYPLGVFILTSFAMAFAGFFITSCVIKIHLLSLVITPLLSIIPFFYISMKKKSRMKKFERQLPEALDLIARSLKAGHALSSGLQMVVQEFEDPIRGEFAKVVDEINFGIGIKEALTNLTERVDCSNLNFFAVAITLQRETGGDLCEILEKISRIIRERFKLHGRIRTLAAEGKLSAIMLIAIPFLVALALSVINPDYIRVLILDPIGKIFITLSFFMMIVGIVVMKKIIEIKV